MKRRVQTFADEQSTLSIPPEGFVRLVSRQIQDTPNGGETGNKTQRPLEMLHYKWSVIGERNWQNPKADKNGFVLGDVYPLNDTRRRGGCNIWECDLTAQSFVPLEQTKPMMGADWHLVIHGSNGQTATADGKSYYDAKQKMAEVIRVVQTRDEAIALPADILLARIGQDNTEVRLKVAAQ